MAKSPAPKTAKTPPAAEPSGKAVSQPSGLVGFILAMLALTGVAVGAGGFVGFMLNGKGEKAAQAHAPAEKHAAEPTKPNFANGAELRPLAPIVTNLAGPKGTWIRFEASLVLAAGAGTGPEINALPAHISEDILAFLRTVDLAQIEGPSGFQHLREDLNDRARVRSGGKVQELVIQTLIVE